MDPNAPPKHLNIKIKGMPNLQPFSPSQQQQSPPPLVPPPSNQFWQSPARGDNAEVEQLREQNKQFRYQIAHLKQENLQQANELRKAPKIGGSILQTSDIINVNEQRQNDRAHIEELRAENQRLNNLLLLKCEEQRQNENDLLRSRKVASQLQQQVSRLTNKLQEATRAKPADDNVLREKEAYILKLLNEVEELKHQQAKHLNELAKNKQASQVNSPVKNVDQLEQVRAQLKKKSDQLGKMSTRLTETLTEMGKLKTQLGQAKQELKEKEIRLRTLEDNGSLLEKKEPNQQPNQISARKEDMASEFRRQEEEMRVAQRDAEVSEGRLKEKEAEIVVARRTKQQLEGQLRDKDAQIRVQEEELRDLRAGGNQPIQNATIELIQREFACYRSEITLKMQSCRKEREELLKVIEKLRDLLPRESPNPSTASSRSAR